MGVVLRAQMSEGDYYAAVSQLLARAPELIDELIALLPDPVAQGKLQQVLPWLGGGFRFRVLGCRSAEGPEAPSAASKLGILILSESSLYHSR